MASSEPTEHERVIAFRVYDCGDEFIAQALASYRAELRADPSFIMPAAAALLKEAGVQVVRRLHGDWVIDDDSCNTTKASKLADAFIQLLKKRLEKDG